MTKAQNIFFKQINRAVNSSGIVELNLVNHNDKLSESIYVGDNGYSPNSVTPNEHTIDVDDIAAFGENGRITSSMLLVHEVAERYQFIVGSQSGDMGYAHAYATAVERIMGGFEKKTAQGWYPSPNNKQNEQMMYIWVRVKGIDISTKVIFTNGNIIDPKKNIIGN